MPQQVSSKLDRRLYKESWSKYEELYKLSDDVLYDLCKRCPDHRDLDGTYAKVQIISLTYRADPGRHGKPIEKVAEFLTSKHLEIDRVFNRLRKVSKSNSSLNKMVLQNVVEEHGSLLELLCKKFPEGRSPRSFLSKYMHFHCPDIVPIFDRIADGEIRKIIPHSPSILSEPLKADGKYCGFCDKFLVLWNCAFDQGLNPTVRKLDRYLIERGNKYDRSN